LLVSIGAVSCYPASTMNLILIGSLMKKNVCRVSTEQHGNMKSGVLWSKNLTSCKLGVIVHCLARIWISIYSATTSKNFMQIAHHLSELW